MGAGLFGSRGSVSFRVVKMSFLSRSRLLALSSSVVCFAPVVSSAQETQNVFAIPAQKLTSALLAFSRQTGLHVVFDGKVADNLRSAPLYGKMDNLKALHKLIGKPTFKIDASNPAFITLRAKAAKQPAGSDVNSQDHLIMQVTDTTSAPNVILQGLWIP